jgi:hypothetical protein
MRELTLLFALTVVLAGVYSGLTEHSEYMNREALRTRIVLDDIDAQRCVFASGLRSAMELPRDAITTERLGQ